MNMQYNVSSKDSIDESKLLRDQYFQSFIKEAYENRLLSEKEVEEIQLNVVKLMERQLKRYTHGESSSVQVEKAQEVMVSTLYGIDWYLKKQNITEVLELIKTQDIITIYQYGKDALRNGVIAAKERWNDVIKNRISLDNLAYNDTLKSITGFFDGYDIEFGAQQINATIDYPLCMDDMSIKGLEYIQNYTNILYLENEFCSYISKESIHLLLYSYSKQNKDLLINIYELLLINAVGTALCHGNIRALFVPDYELKWLESEIKTWDSMTLNEKILTCVNDIIEEFDIDDNNLIEYIKKTSLLLCPRLMNGANNSSLNTVFLPYKNPTQDSAYLYKDQKKMSHGKFRIMTDQIRSSDYLGHKLEIIKKNVLSFMDYLDMLEADCLFNDEYGAVLSLAGDMELAMLFIHMEQGDEQDWHEHLIKLVNQFDEQRKQNIHNWKETIITQ